MNYARIVNAILTQPWAIEAAKFMAILDFIKIKANGGAVVNPPQAAARPRSNKTGSIAVLPIYGVLNQRMNLISEMSGGSSTDMLMKEFKQYAADPDIKAIVLDIDSPGGSVAGIQEFADAVFHARQSKHVVAVANSLAASAAYYIGSQADEFVVTPSGMAGSIGVFTTHQDISAFLEKEGVDVTLISAGKYKVEGNQYEPLTEEALSAEQSIVNQYYDMFVNAVARGRGVSANDVRNGFGEGRVLTSKDAKAQGVADRIATLDDVISGLRGSKPQQRKMLTGDRTRILDMAG